MLSMDLLVFISKVHLKGIVFYLQELVSPLWGISPDQGLKCHRIKKERERNYIANTGVHMVAQQKQFRVGTMRLQVRSLASLSGLRIQHCHELWCRSQMWLRSCIAVAVARASGYSFDYTPSLGISICHKCGLKKAKKEKGK